MQVLVVTEKPSIARRISHILGKGKVTKEKGKSKYTPIHRFKINNDEIIVTSVLGHVKTLDFEDKYNKWDKVNPESLFDAPTRYRINETNKEIPKVINQLQKLGKDADELIIATDADSEGEKIGYDIAEIIIEINPIITVRRMRFSAVTQQDIQKAFNEASKTTLDENLVEKVESRQEIDLRSGSAFTRFQTLGVRKVNPGSAPKIVSFGPCQTAALSFVVERHLEREAFVPEPFWYIFAQIEIAKQLYDLKWEKDRLFDKAMCKKIFDELKKETKGRVEEVITEEKKFYPPKPLNTVQFVSMAAKHLHIASERAMEIAERLYNAGIISYPRTETEIYPRTFSLKKLLEQHAEHPEWGDYVSKLLSKRIRATRGKRDDKAHPPIHPTKSIEINELEKLPEIAKFDKNEVWSIYDMIARHFFATLSMPAIYMDTKVVILIGTTERFNLTGKRIKDKGFLEIYPFRKLAEKEIPELKKDDEVDIANLEMKKGETKPPHRITEAELIKLMDKHGIGTDATIPAHIKTNKDRNYFKISGKGRTIQPTLLGIALIQGLGNIDEMLVKPELRAYIENQTNLVATGEQKKEAVVKDSSKRMRKLFKEVVAKENTLINALAEAIQTEKKKSTPKVELFDCPNCGHPIEIFKGKKGYYLRCTNPDKKECKTSYPLPAGIPRAAKIICPLCEKPIMTMTSPKGNEYNLCPICWTEEIEAEEGKKQRGPCFSCEVEDCKGKVVEEKSRIKCPVCGEGALVTRKGKYGRFLACDRYPDCKTTITLYPGDRVLKKVCECGWPIISRLSKQKKRYYKCSNKEECDQEIDYKEAQKHESGVVKCPVCGKGELIERTGKYGRFLGCSNYPSCKTTISLYPGDNPLKTACPKCGFPLISKLSKQKNRYWKCPNKECDYVYFPKTKTKTKTN
ncbi:MAG: DNA topoisomerase [Promethearchaeota archaeon]